MARFVFVMGAAVWSAVGVGAIGLGTLGARWVYAQLPPLLIDAEALGGGITAVGVALLVVGGAHAALAAAVRRSGRRWLSGAALLSATMAMTLLALAVACATSAVTVPSLGLPLMAAAAAAALGATAYLWCLVWLLRRIGSDATSAQDGPTEASGAG